ncbi:MAG: alpha-galactosidase, partial [Sphingobacteriaceae bacterium]
MKINKLNIILFLLTFVLHKGAFAQSEKWVLELIGDGKQVAITQKGGGTRYSTYPTYKLNGKLVTAQDYAKPLLKKTALNDKQGKGSLVQVTYTDAKLPKLVQSFYVYNGADYILTDFTIESANAQLTSNYMAPLNIKTMPSVLPQGDNRALFIPFDNDKWIRFQSHPLSFDKLTSYEATALFDNNSRKGFIIGSVEHDNWKSAVELSGGDKSNIKSLTFYGGAADTTTRDVIAHGSLTGKVIKSPKVLVGIFADWRAGMEKYGEVNASIAPPREWAGDVPFGWNSWGVLQFKLTYPKAMEVSDYFKNNLQNNNYGTGKTVVIGLDSGWDNFTEEELKAFVIKCEENGQIAGIYWTPFTDWGKKGERTIKEAPQYKFKDAYAYADGKPQELDGAYAVDPTHPAAEERMKYISEKFRRCGFKYVKMDFMSHGSMEADKWHNPDVKTGIQAYNYGMKLINKYFSDMYINLSIAP